MHIERLLLEDFRGFERLDLPLHPRLNVLIGANGAGKSSVLWALRTALFYREAPETHVAADAIRRNLRRGAARLGITVDVRADGLHRLSLTGTDPTSHVARWDPGPPVTSTRAVPVALYLPPNRYLAQPGDAFVGGPLSALQLTRFEDFIAWFRDAENRENEVRLSADDKATYRSPELQAVRRALSTVVTGLPDGEYDRVRFTRVGEDIPAAGVMVVDKRGATLRMDQLSEGESTLLLMVGDIAHRLAVADPEALDPLQGAGVVLIDALELHLHPGWQRAILPALTRAFPKVQFVVTTHSPQVIGEVPSDSVIRLRDFRVAPTPPTFGRDSNSILEEVMGASARHEGIKQALRDLARLIDAEDFTAARARIDALAERLGPDDPDLAGSRAAIDFLAGG